MNKFRQLEKSIGYRFRRKARLEMALTHPSFRHESRDVEEDNQRLEFLGDAVLDLIVAEDLYRATDCDEGHMTKLRSSITCTSALARIARSLDLGAFMIMGRGETAAGGSNRDSNLADALEAVIGAAYIDGGLRAARRIVVGIVLPLLQMDSTPDLDNPKGALQEICQKSGRGTPEYELVDENGPSHARHFDVEVRVDGKVLGRGSESSKNRAERCAAQEALENLWK